MKTTRCVQSVSRTVSGDRQIFKSRMKVVFGWFAALIAVAACSGKQEAAPPAAETAVYFRDVAAAAGLDFVHVNGASPRKYLPEIMGAGGSVLDYDGDGWMDLYLVQSGHLPGSDVEVPACR